MISLQNKQILVGVTGGIAAYKCAELVRGLIAAGASVRVAMTAGAQEFITPLTFQALTGNPVHTSLLDPQAEAGMGHIELARWADLVVVAPASANFIARLNSGEGDDILTTVCLATAADIAIAPAMNQQMWANQATTANLKALQKRETIHIWGPASGIQACGDIGFGRMLEPNEIIKRAASMFNIECLSGTKVVITAGPTREAIDPVRYLTNHSSGKMGYAIAQAAVEAGSKTVLISGPTRLTPPTRVEYVPVTSAQDMLKAALEQCDDADIFIASAAVSDYRPETIATQKIKKGNGDSLVLNLVKNPDIVATIAGRPDKPFTVGFAAETQQLADYAKRKLTEKNLDLIIANDVSDSRIGFNSDNNAVTLINKHSDEILPMLSKSQLARELIRKISEQFQEARKQ